MVHLALYILIGLLGLSSYFFALRGVRRGHYRPNLFSRIVWALLAVNAFASVIASHSTTSSIVLATVFLLGSVAMLVVSIKRGRRTFGRLEWICIALLTMSAVLWVTSDVPLVNLGLGLFAHLLGALPTFRHVLHDPLSESKKFWGLFLASSVLSVIAGLGQPATKLLLPIYYVFLDGTMFALTLRQRQD